MNGIYSGKALDTMERVMGDIKAYIPNKVYLNKVYKIYWYINNRGYMHILRPERVRMNGQLIGYAINDYMLSKDNMLEDKGYNKIYDTLDQLVEAYRQMENKTEMK